MLSPSPGVVTINSRYARRASSVCGIPNLANRLLQVGLLSSIASRPLSPATSALAVSISSCSFILGLAPLPVPDFGHIFSEFVYVLPVLDQLILELLLQVDAPVVGLRQT